jgi:hypothetical protein
LKSKDSGKAGMQMQVEPESGLSRVEFFGTKPAKQSVWSLLSPKCETEVSSEADAEHQG